jgi:hypothetical protein
MRQFVNQLPPPVRERVKTFTSTRAPEDGYKSLSPVREATNLGK